MKFTIVPAMVAGVFIVGAAQASSITLTDSLSGNTIDDAFNIVQFDPMMGTLSGVDFRLVASGAARDSELGGFFGPTGFAEAQVTIKVEFAGFSGDDFDTEFNTCTAEPDDTCFVEANMDLSLVLSEALSATTDDLSAFIGTGTVANSIGTFPGGRAFRSADASVSVTYTYEEPSAVPLPAGAPLLLAGLGAFAIARRRAKA